MPVAQRPTSRTARRIADAALTKPRDGSTGKPHFASRPPSAGARAACTIPGCSKILLRPRSPPAGSPSSAAASPASSPPIGSSRRATPSSSSRSTRKRAASSARSPWGARPLERFYHHLFTSDVDYVSLAEELGLGGEIEWLPSKMGFYSGGRLYPFGTPASLLGFSPLGVKGRLELVLSTLRLRHMRDWRALEGETAIGWLKKNGYGRVLDVVWGPLLTQKYGRRAEEVGLVWLWGKIALRTRSRDKTGLGERLGYMRGSFGRVVEALLSRIASRGGELRPARPVKLASRSDGRWLVEFRGGSETFDLVLSTVAIPELLRIAPDLPADTRELWCAISYTHALCPVLVVDRPLTPFYWTNVGDVTMPFGGFIEHTNYIPSSRYGGNHVIYLSDYVLPDDPKWTMPDRDLWEIYLPAATRLAPELGGRSSSATSSGPSTRSRSSARTTRGSFLP